MDVAFKSAEGDGSGALIAVASNFVPIGNGLKNVRMISSGRLRNFIRGDTELEGGIAAAKDLFKKLTGKEATGDFQRVVLSDSRQEIVLRSPAKSGSGHYKIEVIDHNNKSLEKVTFK